MIRNAPNQEIGFQLNLLANGQEAVGLTPSVRVKKDGSSETSGLGSVVETGNGGYNYLPTQAETDSPHVAFTMRSPTVITQKLNVYTSTTQAELAKVIKSGETGRHVKGTVHSNSDVESTVTRV